MFGVLLTQSQYIFQSVKRHLDDLCVHHGEQVAERPYAPLIDQVPNLIRGSPARGVRDCPSRLFLGFEFGFAENFNQDGEYVRIYDGLQTI